MWAKESWEKGLQSSHSDSGIQSACKRSVTWHKKRHMLAASSCVSCVEDGRDLAKQCALLLSSVTGCPKG